MMLIFLGIAKLIRNPLKTRGLLNTILVIFSYCVDYFFDLKYKTNTYSWVDLDDLGIEDSKKTHVKAYQQTHAVPLRKLLKELKIPPCKILVDLGCGKGRVLLVASEFGFKELRGIEISPLLCDIALKNFAAYQEKTQIKTKLKIVNSDVLDYKIKEDEEVYFLFNPFDEYVLKRIVQNIKDSLEKRSRMIWIIYRNPVLKHVFQENMNVKRYREFVFWGQDFVVLNVEQDNVMMDSSDERRAESHNNTDLPS